MNKTIIININGIVFHIEEDAYEVLRSYMIDIKKHFGRTPDSTEILQDIENRIAEMFSERIQAGKKEVISMTDVEEVIAQMGRVSDFEEADDFSGEEEQPEYTRQRDIPPSSGFHKKLMRNPDNMIISGVCSGLGYYLGMNAKWVRILFVLFFLFGGSGVLLYIVLWVLMPIATSRADRMAMRGEEPNLQNFKKSFEDESEVYGQDYGSNAGFVAKSASSVGSGISGVFRFLGKMIALIMLIFSAMVILGLVFLLVAFALGALGYQDQIVFPPLEYLSKNQALVALLAGILANMIPFIAMFYLFVRILFKTKGMNSYLSLGLWATWIVSIILVITYCILGSHEFKETGTIKVEKPLETKTVYYFTERDLRIIDASTLENGQKAYELGRNTDNFSRLIRNNISIRFERLDSLAKPYIQYNYTAQGRTYQQAAERAAKIEYEVKEDKNRMVFDSHFRLGSSELNRGQSVDVVVFLPVGSSVIIGEPLRDKLRDISYWSCLNESSDENENLKETSWTMQRSGLTCVETKSSKKDDDENE